jgi:hypothetical protein
MYVYVKRRKIRNERKSEWVSEWKEELTELIFAKKYVCLVGNGSNTKNYNTKKM